MTDPRRPQSQRAETVVQRPAHRAATLAHDEALAGRPTPPPPSPPRPRSSLHNATTSPSLDVPGSAEGRAWAERVRALPPAEQLAAVIEQVADGMTTQAQHGVRLDGLDERLSGLREHIDARLDAIDQRLARMSTDVAGVRHELTGARAVLGAAASRGSEAVTRAQRAEAQAREAAAVAGMVAELASERSGDLDIPAVLRESQADPRETVNTGPAASRPGSRRRHETPPAGSAPAGRPAATDEDVTSLGQRLDRIERMLEVAARDAVAKGKRLDGHDQADDEQKTEIAWTKKRLGLLAAVLLVAGYFGRLTYEGWSRARQHTPAAIVRPVASGGH